MNQSVSTIRLRDFMDPGRDEGWGHAEGHRVLERLLDHLKQEQATVYRISLKGVRRTDSSFPRESVIELARRLRGERGVCLIDVANEDLLDNWEAAARKKDQPLLVWSSSYFRLLGPQPTEGLIELYNFIVRRQVTTTSEVVAELGLNASNASNKLKALRDRGFVLRTDRIAASGGVEFEYFVPK